MRTSNTSKHENFSLFSTLVGHFVLLHPNPDPLTWLNPDSTQNTASRYGKPDAIYCRYGSPWYLLKDGARLIFWEESGALLEEPGQLSILTQLQHQVNIILILGEAWNHHFFLFSWEGEGACSWKSLLNKNLVRLCFAISSALRQNLKRQKAVLRTKRVSGSEIGIRIWLWILLS